MIFAEGEETLIVEAIVSCILKRSLKVVDEMIKILVIKLRCKMESEA